MSEDETKPETLPDGRKIEKVPVKVPPAIAQPLTRIAAAEMRLKNVSTVHEGLLAADQYGHIVRRGASDIKKFAESVPESDDTKLLLLNVVEEFEVLAALAAKLWMTIKTHPKPKDKEHETARNDALAQVMKMSTNAGSAVREYLLAVADAEKAKAPSETPPAAPAAT